MKQQGKRKVKMTEATTGSLNKGGGASSPPAGHILSCSLGSAGSGSGILREPPKQRPAGEWEGASNSLSGPWERLSLASGTSE